MDDAPITLFTVATPNNPHSVFRFAEAFARTSDLLVEPAKSDGMLVFPLGVNGAFALELYLKCLFLLENDRPAGRAHHVRDFFDPSKHKTALSERSRELIRAYFERQRKNSGIMDALESAGLKTDFETVLSRCGNAFAALRYAFEGERGSLGGYYGLEWIRRGAREVILDLRPGWKV